jgi:hypothetical protein
VNPANAIALTKWFLPYEQELKGSSPALGGAIAVSRR